MRGGLRPSSGSSPVQVKAALLETPLSFGASARTISPARPAALSPSPGSARSSIAIGSPKSRTRTSAGMPGRGAEIAGTPVGDVAFGDDARRGRERRGRLQRHGGSVPVRAARRSRSGAKWARRALSTSGERVGAGSPAEDDRSIFRQRRPSSRGAGGRRSGSVPRSTAGPPDDAGYGSTWGRRRRATAVSPPARGIAHRGSAA